MKVKCILVFLLVILIGSILSVEPTTESSDSSITLEELLSDFDRCSYVTYGTNPSTTAVIHWGTESETSSIIHYGLTADCSFTITGAGERQNHHVELTSLIPNSIYFYRIEGRTEMCTFKTAPLPSRESSLCFLAFGDNRTNHEDHQSVIDAMVTEEDVCFVLNSGDLVDTGSSTSDWRAFFEVEEELLGKTTYFVAKGNHDIIEWPWEDDPISVLFDVDEYGSFNYGNTHIIWLNSEVYLTGFGDQAEWLESDLIAANEDPNILWKIAFIHKPPYSNGHHGSDISVRESFCPLFKQYGVDLVLNGHEHNYERTYSIGGTTYIVSGGGGAPLRDISPGENTAACNSLLHYLKVDINGPDMNILAKNTDCIVFDSLHIHKASHIITPNITLPVITRVTDNISVFFESKIDPSGIRFSLISKRDGTVYELLSGSFDSDSMSYYNTFCSASLEVPDGIYSLQVTDEFGHTDIQENAVHIIPYYSSSPSIIHLTDTHYGSTSEHTNNLLHALSITDMLNPDFVIISGDITEDGKREQFAAMKNLISNMHVPVFMIPGNHDYYQWDGITGYHDMLSKVTNHSFRYGNYHFLLIDSGADDGFPFYHCYGMTNQQIEWAENKLIENTDAFFTIASMHGPVYDELTPNENNMDNFVDLCELYNVKVCLTGHTHYDKSFDSSGDRTSAAVTPIYSPLFIQTASCAKNETLTPANHFRYIKINGETIEYLTIDMEGSGSYSDDESWDIWNFEIYSEFNDDRTYASFDITNNSFNMFENCRIRPYMLSGYDYSVTGGSIVDSYAEIILNINFLLERNFTHNIIISNTGLNIDENLLPDNYSLSAYPNPFNSSINIICSENLDLHILDMSGRLIKNLGKQRTWTPLDINPSGIYLIIDRTNNLTIPVSYIK